MAEKKVKAREVFQEYAEKQTGLPFGNIDAKSRTFYLTKFYIERIHNILKTEISEDDFEESVTDGKDDLDIDFLHEDDNHWLVLQIRYHKPGHAESDADIGRFKNVLLRLRDPNYRANARLAEAASEIDWENDTFEFVYVTLGEIRGQAAANVKAEPSYPPDIKDLAARCDWEFLDETGLNEVLRQAIAAEDGVPDTVTTLHAAGPKGKRSEVVEIASGQYRSCALIVEAGQLIAAYRSNGIRDALFSLNIRNYIGNTRHNKGIIDTAEKRPQDFLFFNNGVSCLAENIEIDSAAKTVTATKLQVINGAQTVKALVKAEGRQRPATWAGGEPLVLVRITEMKKYGSAKTFRDEITRYNNTQNVIKDADFKSNDAIQTDLRQKFGELTRHARRVVYQAKRTDQRPPNIEEFAKRIYSFLGDPIAFSGSTSYLFDDEKGYSVVFGDGKRPWQEMPDREFRLRSALYWIAGTFSDEIKRDRASTQDNVSRAALERKWFLLFAAKALLSRAYGEEKWKDKMTKLYKGDWKYGQEKEGEWVRSLYQRSKQVVTQVYRSAEKSPGFVHRNWMRSEKTVIAIVDYVSDLPQDDLERICSL
jgi:hypothetical protein